jgi:hypothetical protein
LSEIITRHPAPSNASVHGVPLGVLKKCVVVAAQHHIALWPPAPIAVVTHQEMGYAFF